jgi:hypothetical protein
MVWLVLPFPKTLIGILKTLYYSSPIFLTKPVERERERRMNL